MKVKGTIESIGNKEITVKKGTKDEKKMNKFTVKLKDDQRGFGGFGQCPWKEGEEVEFDFEDAEKTYIDPETKEERKIVFHNIKQKNKASQAMGAGLEKIAELILVPKLTVGLTEKIRHPNGEQYAMKEYQAMISLSHREINQDLIEKQFQELQEAIDSKKKKDGVTMPEETPSSNSSEDLQEEIDSGKIQESQINHAIDNLTGEEKAAAMAAYDEEARRKGEL